MPISKSKGHIHLCWKSYHLPWLFEQVGVEGEEAVEEECFATPALAKTAHDGKGDAGVAGNDSVAVRELEVPDLTH